jgi:8-oxo-dGTP diphosphatase
VTIHYDKIGLLVRRDDRILLCRKSRGTSLLILPGGCLEPNETPEECLRREIREELGPIEVTNVKYIGTYRDQAAGDLSKTVRIALYEGTLTGGPEPHSEIAELIWFGPDGNRAQLSPSIVNKILPDLLQRRILPPSWV